MSPPLVNRLFEALSSQQDLTSFIRRKRDLVILEIEDNFTLVVACDSNASIGLKPNDYVRHDWKEVGRSAAKVPLMEVLAVGGLPFLLVDNLCVEPEPAGLGILEGIRFEVQRLGLDPELVITGSAEKNMPTSQTGVGVTVIGILRSDTLLLGTSKPGDEILCIGIPKNAPELPYTEDDPEIMDPPATKDLRSLQFVHELIPVGSRGVRYEMGVLAAESGLSAVERPSLIPLAQSAGASTCVLASMSPEHIKELSNSVTRPTFHVGTLVQP